MSTTQSAVRMVSSSCSTTISVLPRSRSRVNVGAEFHGQRFEANTVVSYNSQAFWADVLDARFHGATPAFTMVNTEIGWYWQGNKILTSLKVTNLLNERIQQHVFGDLISRQVVAEIRFNL